MSPDCRVSPDKIVLQAHQRANSRGQREIADLNSRRPGGETKGTDIAGGSNTANEVEANDKSGGNTGSRIVRQPRGHASS